MLVTCQVLSSSLAIWVLAVGLDSQQLEDPAYNGKKASEWAVQVKSRERSVRETATRALLHIGAPATPHLVSLLELSSDSYERQAILEVLERMRARAKAAVPAMIAVLRSPDLGERVRALEVLARIGAGAKAAIPALLQSLSDDEPSDTSPVPFSRP